MFTRLRSHAFESVLESHRVTRKLLSACHNNGLPGAGRRNVFAALTVDYVPIIEPSTSGDKFSLLIRRPISLRED